MIYTVTFNPSLDYVVTVPNISYDDVNRVTDEYILPGGKGINVSLVLNNFGIDSVATGIIAGFTGETIIAMLADIGVHCNFVTINDDRSRINIKIKSDKEFEINGSGPYVNEETINALYKIISCIEDKDYLVLGGSVQPSVADTIYKDLCNFASKKGARCIVDASGNLLKNAIKAHPFLIKPNKVELEKLVSKTLDTTDDIIESAKKLQHMGASNVLVSLAKDGAILVADNGKTYIANAPEITVINSVGAGDSMVAGFISDFIQTHDYISALKHGICAGSAAAASKGTPMLKDSKALLKYVSINVIDS